MKKMFWIVLIIMVVAVAAYVIHRQVKKREEVTDVVSTESNGSVQSFEIPETFTTEVEGQSKNIEYS